MKLTREECKFLIELHIEENHSIEEILQDLQKELPKFDSSFILDITKEMLEELDCDKAKQMLKNLNSN